jgi:hypothetical protein
MSAFQAPATMRAVVYKGPYEVAVEDKPYPNLQNDTDCVLKVTTSALCGSDLHFYRGQLKTPAGFVCGHEFVGEIVEKGEKVQKFGLGEKVSFFRSLGTLHHVKQKKLTLPRPKGRRPLLHRLWNLLLLQPRPGFALRPGPALRQRPVGRQHRRRPGRVCPRAAV